MTTLSDLTLKQLTAIYGATAEVATSAKTFNTKARAVSRLETLLAEKGLTIADALKAADIEIKAEPTVPETATALTVAIEPAGTNDAPPTPEANDGAPVDAEIAPQEEEPTAATILTSNRVINDTRDWLVRYLIDSAKLEPETAVLAALRAVTALKLPEPPAQTILARQPRSGTKQETILTLLRRPRGATLAEIAQTAGNWQLHTIRGFLAGLKKKGFAVTSEKAAGATERTYHLPA